MSRIRDFAAMLRVKVFHRDDFHHAGGIPYVLGQGLNSPFIESQLTVHWHPPFSIAAVEEPSRKEGRIHHLLHKLGLKRKSA